MLLANHIACGARFYSIIGCTCFFSQYGPGVPVVAAAVVVNAFNRSFNPTVSAVYPVSVLILHPRDTNCVVTD